MFLETLRISSEYLRFCLFFNNESFIFLDFDGVIKDSVEIKSIAFEQLFQPFGNDIAKKVRLHHEANGGMSRFEKLPIYLSWSGLSSDLKMIKQYSSKFSNLVVQRVIESEWVEGVENFLEKYHKKQNFFLVTATPQQEIQEITNALNISRYFRSIIGSPTKKVDAIRSLLNDYHINTDQSVMIGDSMSDYQGASANNVPFILRKTRLNQDLQRELDCPMIENFNYE